MLLPRLRIRLRGLILLVAVAAVLCLIGFAPEIGRRRAVARREAHIHRRLRQIFSDRGLWVLRGATDVEVYPVRESVEHLSNLDLVEAGPHKQGGREWAQRLSERFLEGERYMVMVGGDDPPNYVVRLRRDDELAIIALAAHGLILHVSVDLVDALHKVSHISFQTDCYDKLGTDSRSITGELTSFLGER